MSLVLKAIFQKKSSEGWGLGGGGGGGGGVGWGGGVQWVKVG